MYYYWQHAKIWLPEWKNHYFNLRVIHSEQHNIVVSLAALVMFSIPILNFVILFWRVLFLFFMFRELQRIICSKNRENEIAFFQNLHGYIYIKKKTQTC